MKINEKGFGVVEILIVIVGIGLIGTVGWLVYDRQKNKTENKATSTQVSQPNAPEGVAQYKDTVNGISFYYPAAWDKSGFSIHKTAISEIVKGTHFGALYSAKYQFKIAENKWYAFDSEGNQVAPYSGYTTITTIPASSYPAVYGDIGEGGYTSYYTVFTDGTSSYMIELPAFDEDAKPNGLAEQKPAFADLLASIKIGN